MLDTYLLCVYYMPDTVPGIWDTAANRPENLPALMELTFRLGGREQPMLQE